MSGEARATLSAGLMFRIACNLWTIRLVYGAVVDEYILRNPECGIPHFWKWDAEFNPFGFIMPKTL